MANPLKGLCEHLREDWEAHGRDWTLPGFRAVAVYRFGIWLHGLQDRLPRILLWRGLLWRPILWRLYRIMYRFVRNHYGIEIYYTASIGRRLIIGHQGGIVIHPRSVIGDDCIIRHNVTIGAASHNRGWERPTLGNRIEVGCGASILGNISVGDGARIGPNVVVMASVPAGSTLFVAPPRMINLERSRDAAQTR